MSMQVLGLTPRRRPLPARAAIPMDRETNNSWQEPVGRSSHSTAVIGDYIYLWSGYKEGMLNAHNSCKKLSLLSNVDVFNVNTGCWEHRNTHGKPPLGVCGYCCVAVKNDLLYFGGWCGHNCCNHNSIHSLSTPALQWKNLAPTTELDGGPMRKSHCGMVRFNDGEEDLLYIVGGYGHSAPLTPQHGAQYELSNGVCTNEQHIFSLSNGWSSPEVTGQPPPPCSSFTLTTIKETMAAMYGGMSGSSILLDDLFILVLGKFSVNWTKICRPIDHSIKWPKGRFEHAAARVSSSVFVILGGSGCWLCDVTNKQWKRLHGVPKSLMERQRHSVSAVRIEPHCVWMLVFGGSICIAGTAIIELIQVDNQWIVGKVMEKDSLCKSTQYQEILSKIHMASSLKLKKEEIKQLQLQLQETALALEHSQQKARQKEEENHLLQQHLYRAQEALQAANKRVEESQQTTREREEELHETAYTLESLQQSIREKDDEIHDLSIELQEQIAGQEKPHWMLNKEEIEMTEEELGRGGWGVVKVAKFRGLRVAAKCLHQTIISDYNRRQFSREMTIAAKLRHPNLLLFIGATTEAELIIITELMATSLRKELEKEELMAKEQIVAISQDVSCGLSYMHQSRPHPIIHRDISSGNVLLEPLSNGYMKAKISDYGSANFTNLIASTIGPGSPAYAAPEARFPNNHSPKMDVFSLGVLMMEMCIREFPESTVVRRTAQIHRIDWPAMVTLIRRCISERPDDRPNTLDIVSALDKL